MKFSVIVVSLNAGEKLIETIKNILAQKDVDLEIVLKDGLSKDGSTNAVKDFGDTRVRIFEMKDTGIYDGMNQGISNASGDFYIFMNCGDFFYDDMVLARFEKAAEEYIARNADPLRKQIRITDGKRGIHLTQDHTPCLLQKHPMPSGNPLFKGVLCKKAFQAGI